MNECDNINPIFITGTYRSGTTLLTQLIKNHNKSRMTYDSVHFMRFSYNKYMNNNGNIDYVRLLKDTQNRLQKRWGWMIRMDKIVDRIRLRTVVDYHIIYHEMMLDILLGGDESLIWGEKENVCWGKIPDFLSMFPGGKAIHVIRDPRDVLASFKKFTYEPGLRYLDAIFTSIHSMQKAKEYQESLSNKNYMVVKYEDLIIHKESIIKSVCEFIGISYYDTLLNHEQFKDNYDKPWMPNTAFGEKIEGFSGIPIGRYRRHLNKIEIYLTELIARWWMLKFGYVLEGVLLNKEEWCYLYEILEDDFVSSRFKHWVKTNEGVEGYPSSPPLV